MEAKDEKSPKIAKSSVNYVSRIQERLQIKIETKPYIFCFFYRAMLRRGYAQFVVCLSVRPSDRPSRSVTFRYRDHIVWNTSKIISRLISLRFMLGYVSLTNPQN